MVTKNVSAGRTDVPVSVAEPRVEGGGSRPRPRWLVALTLLVAPALTGQHRPGADVKLRIQHGARSAVAGMPDDGALRIGFGVGDGPGADPRRFVAPLCVEHEPAGARPANGDGERALPAAERFTVCEWAGVRIACVVFADAPDVAGAAGSSRPAARLRALCSELEGEVDLVLLLADADRVACAAWLREATLPTLALVPVRTGVDPEPLRMGATCLVQSPIASGVAGELGVTFAAGGLGVVTNRFVHTAPVPASDVEAHVRGFLDVAVPAGPAGTSDAPDATATVGVARVLRVDAEGLRTRRTPTGLLLLVLDVELCNETTTRQALAAGELPVITVDPMRGLVLEVDGAREVSPDGEESARPGGLLAAPLVLPRPGSRCRGTLCFPLAAAPARSLALRVVGEGGEPTRIALPLPEDAREHAPGERRGTDPNGAESPPATEGDATTHSEVDAEHTDAPLLGLTGHGITQEQVDESIARGGAFLWSRLRTSSAQQFARYLLAGHTNELLGTLALVHSGEPSRSADCAAWVEELLDGLRPSGGMQTYQAGVLAMLVEATGAPRHLPLLRQVARFLVESQGRGGTWGYGTPVADDLLLDPDQRVLQVIGGRPLDGSPKDLQACPRLSAPELGRDGDNSCTQFALLGLRAARRCDLEIPAEVWERARAAMLRRQLADGGFGYEGSPHESASGSMTAAGVCSLAITADALGLPPPAEDEAIQRGVRWLDRHFRVDTNPFGGWHSYYRYSLERTGRILDSERLGRHEWYPLGVQHLLGTQQQDGSWIEPASDPVLETSFSLLFLTRATARLRDELHRGGSGTLVTGAALSAVGRVYLVLDASGSMLEQRDGATKFDVARASAAALVEALPEGTEVALRVYGHTKRSTEPGADEDSALVLPFAPRDCDGFAGVLRGLRARGRTPLALSLQQARADLASRTDAPVTVVLLTDGAEDARSKLDPARAAEELRGLGNVAFHVVGFDIDRADWRGQLERVAAAGGGRFWPAPRGADLGPSLLAAVLKLPPEWRLLDVDGRDVARGRFGDRVTLPEGRYAFVTSFAGRAHEAPVWINTGATTSVLFDGTRARVE